MAWRGKPEVCSWLLVGWEGMRSQEQTEVFPRFFPPCQSCVGPLWTAACHNSVSHNLTTKRVVQLRELHFVWKTTLWKASVRNGDRGILQKLFYLNKGREPTGPYSCGVSLHVLEDTRCPPPFPRYSLPTPSTTYSLLNMNPLPHHALHGH